MKLTLPRIFVLFFLLRFTTVWIHDFPAGHDITLVANLAKIYSQSWQNGQIWPRDYNPIYGPFPLHGFHSILGPIIAFFLTIWPNSLFLLLKILNAAAFILCDGAIALILHRISKHEGNRNVYVFLVTLLVNYASPVPGRFLASGGGVFVFAYGLSLFGLYEIIKVVISPTKQQARLLKIMGLFLLSVLIHPMPSFHTLLFTPFFLYFIATENNINYWKQVFSILVSVALSLTPIYFIYAIYGSSYSSAIYSWLKVVKDHYTLFPYTHENPIYYSEQVLSFLGFLLKQFSFLIPVFFYMILYDRHGARLKTFIFLFSGMVILTWFGSFLPFVGKSFYPDRMMHHVIILSGLALMATLKKNIKIKEMSKWLVFYIVFLSTVRFSWNYIYQGQEKQVITHHDMNVISYIQRTVDSKSLIYNDYYGAGIWIPALTGYPVSEPHFHIAMEKTWLSFKNSLIDDSLVKKYGFDTQKCSRGLQCKKLCTVPAEILFQSDKSTFCLLKNNS